MLRYVVAWLGAGLLLAGLDAVWLTTTNASLYRPTLGKLLADSPHMDPGPILHMLVYLLVVSF